MSALFSKLNNSIVREIQSEILSDDVRVANIVRKARLAARKLDLKDFEKWLIKESDGYKGIPVDEMPDYRKIGAIPRFFNPYRGWCPIIVEDEKIYELCHTTFLYQPIEELESYQLRHGI